MLRRIEASPVASGVGGGTSAVPSLRDLFPEWLRHEGKSCPREGTAENPRRCRLRAWSLLSGFAADRKDEATRRAGSGGAGQRGKASVSRVTVNGAGRSSGLPNGTECDSR
ncbi:hypothetical protein GCM10020366_55790 [Saccharopolyspora gregorii]|uniref:Uncharacterized protein n=1 Tax=Saccharopolyspora gregorii TaxID=33914 RepID=A0ABP6RYP2_9PSEU